MIKFTKAVRTNYDRDGIDILFYFVEEGASNERYYHVVGKTNCWNKSDLEIIEYSEQLFNNFVQYMTNYWSENKAIPQTDYQYCEGRDFFNNQADKKSWKGFELSFVCC